MSMAQRRRPWLVGALSAVCFLYALGLPADGFAQQADGPTAPVATEDRPAAPSASAPATDGEPTANDDESAPPADAPSHSAPEGNPDTPGPRPQDARIGIPGASGSDSVDDAVSRYRGLPSGPSVDTPSMPVAPSVVDSAPEPIALPPVQRVDIALDWHPGPTHAALIIAKARGLFARRGLDVRLQTPADPDVPSKLVAASRATLAVTDQPTLHRLVDQGKPLVRVATLIELPLSALIVRRASGIDSALALIDHRIGYADDVSHDVLLRAVLDEEGLNLNHVTPRDVHFGAVSAMAEGRVDAFLGGLRFTLPRQLADLGIATRLFTLEDLGIPIHDGLILVANLDHYRTQREIIRPLVDGLQEATEWIIQHPDKAWGLMVSTEPTLDTAANAEAWPQIRRRLALRPGAVDRARYRRLERHLWESGILKALTDVDRLARDPG
ncbi:ABC transporter substrate-binding protein [Halomonas sp. V046]|uniref:ABC transporter substrate-binding protein n=1 Tax=Halomonas sp. V046 TaxID=3459611 RepID=UPI004045137A